MRGVSWGEGWGSGGVYVWLSRSSVLLIKAVSSLGGIIKGQSARVTQTPDRGGQLAAAVALQRCKYQRGGGFDGFAECAGSILSHGRKSRLGGGVDCEALTGDHGI